ncbi:hydroxymethylpyrimidine/phosphomethylpyrimidine kinase [Celeribacter persicus]|uniref:hydroxymethylpyrimidine kinase n=1 Tax=Celeribacter persicus TaxID=1651082 RepID=A0A2T5H9N4_9RHOB|nr:hydroxymethylpyrimidine/phosphomethylpyrimidine kinase [Celeribacter persicus]PTQ68291.1 hydroxymethylpyrimidine/phosphomethylpyrimidine kinase [Celeribacter persicus]
MSAPVLMIGGLDSSGGAGVLRDCAVANAFGVTARVAVTAVTAQSDHAVSAVHLVSPDTVRAQIAIAGQVGAVKIGMLGTAGTVRAVADTLPPAPCVLDPVLMSSSGHMLLDEAGTEALLDCLLPKTDLLTPNLPELSALARHFGLAPKEHEACVARLLQRGCGAVLVKGGHAGGTESVDRLYRPGLPVVPFTAPRTNSTLRGTGCRLASAIAAHLSKGARLVSAIETGKAHVHEALSSTSPP